MPLIIIKLSWRLFLTSMLFWFLLLETYAEPKVEIALFKYLGALEGHKANEKFENFHGILNDKLLSMTEEVSSQESAGENLDYLKRIHIEFHDKDNFSGLEGINRWMKNEADVLTLLRGSIISDDDKKLLRI